jgi:hypothetical protein
MYVCMVPECLDECSLARFCSHRWLNGFIPFVWYMTLCEVATPDGGLRGKCVTMNNFAWNESCHMEVSVLASCCVLDTRWKRSSVLPGFPQCIRYVTLLVFGLQ